MTVFDAEQDDFFIRPTDVVRKEHRDLKIKAVVFDLGGVLVANGPRLGVLARLLGHNTSKEDRAAVAEAIWKYRLAYDLDESSEEYWSKVAEELGATDYDLNAVIGAEADRWSHILPDAIDLIDELEDSSIKLGALCNAPRDLALGFDDFGWAMPFVAARFSGLTGILVPEKKMLKMLEKDLKVKPDEILFFDNNQAHVDGAKERGWDAHLWTDADEARRIVVDRGILD